MCLPSEPYYTGWSATVLTVSVLALTKKHVDECDIDAAMVESALSGRPLVLCVRSGHRCQFSILWFGHRFKDDARSFKNKLNHK